MWSQFENRREIDYVLGHTNPKHVWFVLDTGHITMAGMDPVELARTLGHRIVEFHMKDTKPEWRGGAKTRLDRPDMMNDPPFFPLGKAASTSHPQSASGQNPMARLVDGGTRFIALSTAKGERPNQPEVSQ